MDELNAMFTIINNALSDAGYDPFHIYAFVCSVHLSMYIIFFGIFKLISMLGDIGFTLYKRYKSKEKKDEKKED